MKSRLGAAIAALAAAGVFIGLGLGQIRSSAPAFDEPMHLASGYVSLLGAERPTTWRVHPVFAEMWSALPLLRLKPDPRFDHAYWSRGDIYNHADVFLYQNVVPAEELLDRSRIWCLLTWAIVLAGGVFLWSLRLGGPSRVLAAAPLIAFCPPLIAHAALISPDYAAGALYFATFWALSGRPRLTRHCAVGGASMGLAMASSYAMALLPAVVLSALAWENRMDRRDRSLSPEGLLVLGGACLSTIALVYRVRGFGVFWTDLIATMAVISRGWPSFLMGGYSEVGFALYFPATLAVKTPLPLLILAAWGLLAVWRESGAREKLWLLLPPAIYLFAVSFSKTQAGYRHILGVYPFLIIVGAAGLASLWKRERTGKALASALVLWQAASALRAHPHHLAYFNEAAGGPSRGYRFLVDSDLDWGQGLKALSGEIRRRGNPPIYLSYFGTADPSYYGLRYIPVAPTTPLYRHEGVAGAAAQEPLLLAVSATNLQGVYYDDKKAFAWLKSRSPVHQAGFSIFLYDLTNDAEGRRQLQEMLAADKK